MKNITKWLLASAACGLLSLASAQATTYDLTNNMSYSTDSQYLVGTVIPGLQGQFGGQAQRDAYMANVLRGMALHTQGDPNSDGALYSRTTWPQGPVATAVGAVMNSGTIPDGGPTLDITLTGTFQYLVVAYDGPNADAGAAVFDISSFAAGDTITVARYANAPDPSTGDLVANATGPYKITSWTLLNPTGVPDGGTTVMLLGMGLGALGMVRRYLVS